MERYRRSREDCSRLSNSAGPVERLERLFQNTLRHVKVRGDTSDARAGHWFGALIAAR